MKEQSSADKLNKFIDRIQQEKMKELWDNKDDEAWENAIFLGDKNYCQNRGSLKRMRCLLPICNNF
jgi:hypothetical protein